MLHEFAEKVRELVKVHSCAVDIWLTNRTMTELLNETEVEVASDGKIHVNSDGVQLIIQQCNHLWTEAGNCYYMIASMTTNTYCYLYEQSASTHEKACEVL